MRHDRRRFLKQAFAAAAAAPSAGTLAAPVAAAAGVWVNDVHTGLSATRVNRVVVARTPNEAAAHMRDALREGRAVCIAGGRHSSGGQPFARDALLVDTRGMDRVLDFDRERGRLQVEAGIRWPQVLAHLELTQAPVPGSGVPRPDPWWTFAQKPAVIDDATLGGCVAANTHGSGLAQPPFIATVESLTLMDASGEERLCSRAENAELFRLVFGGHGLFGLVTTLTLRLVPRQPLQRVVELTETPGLMARFARRAADGFVQGECLLSTDARSDDFLRRGVLVCHRPASGDEEPSGRERELGREAREAILALAHTDPEAAFQRLADFHLGTHRQVYWSDELQMGAYPGGYHARLDPGRGRASDSVIELLLPRHALEAWLEDARRAARAGRWRLVDAAVRLVERDTESAFAWAREPWACVALGLHVEHDAAGRRAGAAAQRALIALALRHRGSWFPAYEAHATRAQWLAGHPRLPALLDAKHRLDPRASFQSEWHRHLGALLAAA